MKKRKNRKSKKSSASYGFLLILLIIFAFLAFYLYRTNPDFRAKTDEKISLAKENAERILNDSPLSKKEPSEESPAKKTETKPSTKKNEKVLLKKGLETPVCGGNHNKKDHQIRNFEHYSLCYRESYEQAEWSAYCLTEEELVKKAKRSDDFRSDPEISTGSASPADYKKSGYDRGHLSPAADFAFDQKAMSETFYMSNMSPQKGSLNRGIWKDLEAEVRLWAKSFGRVYVVSGPVLEKEPSEYESIGENYVSVPEFYYKVILAPLYADEADKATPEDSENVIAMAYTSPNKKCEGSLDDYAVSVDEVEARTKLDFFSLLEDEVENEVEAKLGRYGVSP